MNEIINTVKKYIESNKICDLLRPESRDVLTKEQEKRMRNIERKTFGQILKRAGFRQHLCSMEYHSGCKLARVIIIDNIRWTPCCNFCDKNCEERCKNNCDVCMLHFTYNGVNTSPEGSVASERF